MGTLERDARDRRWLVPFDPRLDLELEVEGAAAVPPGHFVEVEVARAPGSGRDLRGVPTGQNRPVGAATAGGGGASRRRRPRAGLVAVLGDPETPGVDVEVVLRHYDIREPFPPEVLDQAAAFPDHPPAADWAGREDLRERVVVTIDGASARDFDDAVSIERLAGGVFRLGVHIADVAHYVREGSALDHEAYRRGTSVYYPERAIPMLPEALSNGLCSLGPQVPRLTVSVFLDIDRDGRVLARRFAETVIRSHRRLTYDEVRALLEAPKPEAAAAYGAVLPALREMHHLMAILHHARARRGSIDFDLPEGNVELGTDGSVVGILPAERHVAHRLIEEFMIAANEAVAGELVSRRSPGLFRVHDAPDVERLQELAETLRPFGIELPAELDALHPTALQQVLRHAAGRPEEELVTTLLLRTMQRAYYSPDCLGHYALATPYYTHFTSPIRRYPDLVVHRRLKALLHGRAELEAERGRLGERLPVIARANSNAERRAEQSERDLLQWKKVRFLAGRAGERFRGRITGVQAFGFFVQLDGLHVDGLVPIRTLGDDFYIHEPGAHRLVGERQGRVFQLADAVEVELLGADLRHRGLDLQVVGMPPPRPRSARRRPPPHRGPAADGEGGARRARRGARGAPGSAGSEKREGGGAAERGGTGRGGGSGRGAT